MPSLLTSTGAAAVAHEHFGRVHEDIEAPPRLVTAVGGRWVTRTPGEHEGAPQTLHGAGMDNAVGERDGDHGDYAYNSGASSAVSGSAGLKKNAVSPTSRSVARRSSVAKTWGGD